MFSKKYNIVVAVLALSSLTLVGGCATQGENGGVSVAWRTANEVILSVGGSSHKTAIGEPAEKALRGHPSKAPDAPSIPASGITGFGGTKKCSGNHSAVVSHPHNYTDDQFSTDYSPRQYRGRRSSKRRKGRHPNRPL